MLLADILYRKKILDLGYDTIFLEQPMSNIIDFDYRSILKPPPLNTDKSVRVELDKIISLTKNRTQQDMNLIYLIDENLDGPFIELTHRYNLVYPQRYINLLYDIIKPILFNVKGFWNRARPIQLAKLLGLTFSPIITDTVHTASYPSGHTVYSSLVAYILKDYYPQIDQKQLDMLVSQTAQARVLQGVHYPSDNAASLVFTKYVFDKIHPKLRKYKNDKI